MKDTFFETLTLNELEAVAAPVQSALSSIANGDGSIPSVVGHGVALVGELGAVSPELQKIAITGFAAFLNAKIAEALAAKSNVKAANL